MKKKIGRIEALLKVGRENAIKSDALMKLTGHDRRTIQALVAREREEGAMILADEAGYYLARNRQEAAAYYRRGTAAAKRLIRTLRHIKRFGEGTEGQLVIDEERR